MTTPSPTPQRTPRQSIVDTTGGRALLIALAGLAMAMLIPLVGLVFTLFALGVSVRTTLELRRAKERGGQLELAAPRPAVRKILQVTGLDSVFTVLDESVVASGQ